ncbi:hypothetical protein QFC19_002500 [Naganishia cerealis]|uniref:Uncharacterized protein n=1 Tax=Naganishia cerealis TaxID=610337 RepID=A0ACC2WB05_9TREE|nr:hypothetical protein QFC19_002500 [Naganishia cerealis]
MFSRVAASSVRIAARGTRSAATFTTEGVKGNDFKALRDATKAHAGETSDLWRKIREANGGELPERPVYPYMNIRNKPFPWGQQSLFFNPEVNITVGEE